jgi:hypothetical protein
MSPPVLAGILRLLRNAVFLPQTRHSAGRRFANKRFRWSPMATWTSGIVSACHWGDSSYGSWDRIPTGYRVIAFLNKKRFRRSCVMNTWQNVFPTKSRYIDPEVSHHAPVTFETHATKWWRRQRWKAVKMVTSQKQSTSQAEDICLIRNRFIVKLYTRN